MEGDRSFAFSTAINNDSKVTTSTLGVAHPMEACPLQVSLRSISTRHHYLFTRQLIAVDSH